jgi:molybdenum cofactor biosynthesis enzyme MoaA
MRALVENPAPVIWIGGSEPLLHSGIGHFMRAIAQSGHCVFLETDGTFLRRRIHEFEPLPELFLTVRLESPESSRYASALEGLAAARLSGFFTVVHSIVRKDSELAPFRALSTFLFAQDLDGWLITAASLDEAAARKATEARGLISSGFWRQLSEHVEEALVRQSQGRESRLSSTPLADSAPAEAHEEGVGIA